MVASLATMYIKMKVFIEQFRNRREEVWEPDCLSERAKKIQKHKKRLTSTGKAIKMIYASMMIGCLECVPMGVLQILYSQVVQENDLMTTLSLVTTWGYKASPPPPAPWRYFVLLAVARQ